MQRQQITILIIAITLALVAVFMVNTYINQQRQSLQEQAQKSLANMQENQSAVLVAKKEIPRGTFIDVDMLETQIVPNQYLQPKAVTSLDRITGMATIAPIAKGEQITLTKLANSRQAAASGLAEATPVGKRAITIAVDNIASLSGMIKPGDYVDVIAMIPIPVQTADGKTATQTSIMPLFQNVLVLAVGQETAALEPQGQGRYRRTEEQRQQASPFITIALSPQEANLIAFVQEQGKLRLVLRSPADSQVQPPTPPVGWDTLFQYLMPKQQEAPKQKIEQEVKPSPAGYVEIYRGIKKDKVPLEK